MSYMGVFLVIHPSTCTVDPERKGGCCLLCQRGAEDFQPRRVTSISQDSPVRRTLDARKDKRTTSEPTFVSRAACANTVGWEV